MTKCEIIQCKGEGKLLATMFSWQEHPIKFYYCREHYNLMLFELIGMKACKSGARKKFKVIRK